MRYRALDPAGDYTFGTGPKAYFLENSPACVAQAVATRLGLYEGEWFLDTSAGTPWFQAIVGDHTTQTYDQALRSRILGTEGVAAIASYSSSVVNRALAVSGTIDTIYPTSSAPFGAVVAQPGVVAPTLVTETGVGIVTDTGQPFSEPL